MSSLKLYRDDGPLARALGRLGTAVPLWPVLLVLLAMAPGIVVIVLEGDGASDALAGACVAWLVVVGSLSAGRPLEDRLRWAVPPLLRVAEYGAILWLASLDSETAVASAFALLCVAAFRHYDLVYRLRYRGAEPSAWTGVVSLGWEGRVLVTYVLLVAGALPAGLYVLAGVLAVVLVGESVASWTSSLRNDSAGSYEDEEDDAP